SAQNAEIAARGRFQSNRFRPLLDSARPQRSTPMAQSTRLALPYLAAAQAQKHVTVNESLLRLDALVQLSAASATLAEEPAEPADASLYLLPPGKTGAAWGAMADGAVAYYRDGVWEELAPRPGWRVFVEDEAALYARTLAGWERLAAAGER